MGNRKKTEITFSVDIEVVNVINENITPLTNKSAYINNLLRKALGLSYMKTDD